MLLNGKRVAYYLNSEELDPFRKGFFHAISESFVHRDLSPIDIAEAYARLIRISNYSTNCISIGDAAMMVGRHERTIRRYLQLLKLPKSIQKKLHEGRMTITQALKK